MRNSVGFDWVGYFHSQSDDEIHELAAWLAAERLNVGEFMEVVDRVYARTSDEWRGQASVFVAWFGRQDAQEYARRKRHFAERMAALEEAGMTGALSGDVAPEELKPLQPRWADAPSAETTLRALEGARRDAE